MYYTITSIMIKSIKEQENILFFLSPKIYPNLGTLTPQ